MRDIEIRINDNKTCEVVTPQPLVEGENRTTQIKLIGTPTSWTDFTVMCLLTTPAGALVDAVPLPCELLNSMLDAAGTLKAEFIATRVGTDTEVDRTKNAALLPVSAARSPLGEIAPEPLPNYLAQMEVARTGALDATITAQEAAALIAGVPEAEALRAQAEAARVIAEQNRVDDFGSFMGSSGVTFGSFMSSANASMQNMQNSFNTAEAAREAEFDVLVGSLTTIDNILAELVGDI